MTAEEHRLRRKLGAILFKEKCATDHWYERMSGQFAWLPTEKEKSAQNFETLAAEIDRTQDEFKIITGVSY